MKKIYFLFLLFSLSACLNPLPLPVAIPGMNAAEALIDEGLVEVEAAVRYENGAWKILNDQDHTSVGFINAYTHPSGVLFVEFEKPGVEFFGFSVDPDECTGIYSTVFSVHTNEVRVSFEAPRRERIRGNLFFNTGQWSLQSFGDHVPDIIINSPKKITLEHPEAGYNVPYIGQAGGQGGAFPFYSVNSTKTTIKLLNGPMDGVDVVQFDRQLEAMTADKIRADELNIPPGKLCNIWIRGKVRF